MTTSPDAPYAIGLDLGGTDLKFALVHQDGTLEAFGKCPSRAAESAEGPLLAMAAAARLLAGEMREAPIGVGVGSPGAIDPATGALLGATPHLRFWEAFPLRERLASELELPVVVDNDANLAALAEHRLGAARGARVSITITLGTGIGCGIVVDGRVLRGANGGAGELGHLPLGRAGEPCRCGVRDCVEPEASGSGLARHARELDITPTDAAGVFAAAAAGNDRARALLDRMVDRLGATIGAAVSLLNPDVVVVGGGIGQAGEPLMAPLREAVAGYTLATHSRRLRIVPAALGERAGVAGAGLFAWDEARASAERFSR
jgi:glucokinase